MENSIASESPTAMWCPQCGGKCIVESVDVKYAHAPASHSDLVIVCTRCPMATQIGDTGELIDVGAHPNMGDMREPIEDFADVEYGHTEHLHVKMPTLHGRRDS